MKSRLFTSLFVLAFLLSSCQPLSSTASQPPAPPPTQVISTETSAPASATPIPADNTATPLPSPDPSSTATTAPSPTEPPVETYIATVQNDALLVTHILGGKALETHEFIKSSVHEGIRYIGWSPSGEYLAFAMIVDSFAHVYVVNVKEGGKPVDLGIADLGIGNNWAWSPDSKLLAFTHEYELWVYSPSSGAKKPLTTHLGVHWLWSLPVFTPDGKSLWAVGTDSHTMDRHGVTHYRIYRIPLDGSGASNYPPGNLKSITEEMSGVLPSDLRFSPDGKKLAINAADYIENCAQKSSYKVGNPDGTELHDFPIPSLAGLVGPNQDPFFNGDSLAWDPQSTGLWVNGAVRDCTISSTIVAGPKISFVTLDGQEQEQIPGAFSHLSIDPTGALLGVVNENQKDAPRVQILGRDGHLVLDLGEGYLAALQP